MSPLCAATLADLADALGVSESTLCSSRTAATTEGRKTPLGPPFRLVSWWAWCCVETPRAPLLPLSSVLKLAFPTYQADQHAWLVNVGLVADSLTELAWAKSSARTHEAEARMRQAALDVAEWASEVVHAGISTETLQVWAAAGQHLPMLLLRELEIEARQDGEEAAATSKRRNRTKAPPP